MTTLRRTLGTAGLTFYGVGMIVGAGVYTVIGAAAGLAGGALWLSFALGAAVALLTGLSYAELAAMFPRAGAEYVYARAAFPRSAAAPFVLGVVFAAAGAATAATVSLAFAAYLGTWVELPSMPLALGLLACLTAVNLLGMRLGGKLNVAFTLLEVAGLVAFIVLGATRPTFGRGMLEISPAGVFAGASVLFFAYLGFEQLVNLTEEAKHPARDVPRAILLSVGMTTLIYVGVGLAATSLMEPARLAASQAPLASAAESAAPWFARALTGVALFATANTALIALLSTSRLVFGMGRDGAAPKALAKVHRRTRAPWVATLVVGGLASALVPLGGVAVVARLASFAALLAFVAVNVCHIVLRFREPRRPRPFRVPLAVGRLPVFPVLGLASAGLLLLHFDKWDYVAGALAIGVAIALYGVHAWWSRRAARRPA